MSLLQVVLAILNRVTQVLSLVGIIQNQTSKVAQENVPFEIATNTAISRGVLDWSDSSPGALKLRLLELESQIGTGFDDVLAAIAALPDGTSPVVLPTTPPTGYGGGGGGSTAADIWNYQYPPGSGNIMGDKVVKSGRFSEFLAQDAWFPHAYVKYIGHHFDYSNYYIDPATYPLPLVDPSTILTSDDSIVDWLNRTVTGFDWELLNNQVISYSHTPLGDEWWVCTITDLEFQQYKGGSATPQLFFAPVWPGEENVTFSTRLTLEDQMHVEVDCHGLYIHITGVPTGCNFYQFGPVKSYRNIGAVQFISDDGNEEMAQPLAMEYGQYCCKAMYKAHGFLIRCKGGVTGTVDPWLITPA